MRQHSARVFVLALFLLAPTAVASAQVINGCVGSNGSLRIVLPAEPCKNSEFAISWNTVGPQGPAGPAGATGPQGPAGAQGPAGDAVPPPQVIGTVTVSGLAASSIYELSGGVQVAISTGGGGSGAGNPKISPVVVTKRMDGTSAALFKNAVEGKPIATVTIDIPGGTQRQIKLTNVLISGYSLVQLPGSDAVYERVTFSFEKIEFNIDGQLGCFDPVKGTGC